MITMSEKVAAKPAVFRMDRHDVIKEGNNSFNHVMNEDTCECKLYTNKT